MKLTEIYRTSQPANNLTAQSFSTVYNVLRYLVDLRVHNILFYFIASLILLFLLFLLFRQANSPTESAPSMCGAAKTVQKMNLILDTFYTQ